MKVLADLNLSVIGQGVSISDYVAACHRIIRSDGDLGGFSCPVSGAKTKAKLLAHEQKMTA